MATTDITIDGVLIATFDRDTGEVTADERFLDGCCAWLAQEAVRPHICGSTVNLTDKPCPACGAIGAL